MIRVALLAIVACLAGCDVVKAGFTPADQKVNEAFPIPDEVQVARTRLLASLEGNKAARKTAQGHLDKLMELRAMTCTTLTPPARFDTPADLKARAADTTCFATQDAALDEWIGIQRVALALAAPPLVQAAPLPAKSLLPNTAESVAAASIAASANVLVVRTQQQQLMALQVPSGKQISSFSAPEQNHRPPSVSPNGRLVAIPGGKGMRFYDVATGQSIWSTPKYMDLIAWLPQVQAVVLAQTGTSAPSILDGRTSKIWPYPSAEKRVTWSAPLSESQLLVGSQNTVTVMQHARSAAGALEMGAVRQWLLPSPGITNAAPHVMQDGKKLVWHAHREIGWIDLHSGQHGSWSFAPLNVNSLAKADETHLVFNMYVPGSGNETRVLDIDSRTVATAKDLDGRDGQIFPLPPRAAFLKRSANAMILAGSVEGESPQDLDRLVAEANLTQQLAKLNAETAGQAAASAAAEAAAAAQAAAQGRGSPSPVERGAVSPHVRTALANVPRDARVAFVGVYEPDPRGGSVRINVTQDSAPLVLVLSSYEPVRWVINPGARKIAAVLLSGYNPSTVVGQGRADVLRIGSRSVYKLDSPEYLNLKGDVARHISNPIQSFQGTYKGREFNVR